MSRALPVLALLLFPATASAAGSGGTLAGPTARGFTATPASVAPARRSRSRSAPRRARSCGSTCSPPAGPRSACDSAAWSGGDRARRLDGRRRPPASTPRGSSSAAPGSTRYLRVAAERRAPAAAAPRRRRHPATLATTGSKVFPVQGPYTLRRRGLALRRRPHRSHPPGPGHRRRRGHAGRRPGRRHRALDRLPGRGRRHYVVIAGADGRHYVFMHLQAGSIVVTKGAPVTAGQRLGSVGNTGASERPAPALRDLGQRLVGLEGLRPDRPAARSSRPGPPRRSIAAISDAQPSLVSGSLRLPHFGDCTHDGQPDSHGHSLTSR